MTLSIVTLDILYMHFASKITTTIVLFVIIYNYLKMVIFQVGKKENNPEESQF